VESETHIDIKPALHLPKNLKDHILTDQRLSQHQKFVLFTLYYLDSKGKLNEYGTYVPHFLNLQEEDFQKNIDDLVRHKYSQAIHISHRALREIKYRKISQPCFLDNGQSLTYKSITLHVH
jgi:hypothetical protein